MTAKQVESGDIVENQTAQDFKLIRGIGPAIEGRIHSAGITQYAQLAEMSPSELAIMFKDLTGLSENWIAKQDWIGQARKLAEKYPAVTEIEEEATSQNRQHYAVFTIELLLDETNAVRRTRVMHVQSQQEYTWAGWDDRRLVMLLVEKAGINAALSWGIAPRPETELANNRSPIRGEAEGEAGDIGGVDAAGQLRIQLLSIAPAGYDRSQVVISHDQPYDIHLTLDMAEVNLIRPSYNNYVVNIYSKSLRDGSKTLIAETQGNIERTDEIEIVLKGSPLPVGTYRLEALAMIYLQPGILSEHARLMAMLEGQVIKVI